MTRLSLHRKTTWDRTAGAIDVTAARSRRVGTPSHKWKPRAVASGLHRQNGGRGQAVDLRCRRRYPPISPTRSRDLRSPLVPAGARALHRATRTARWEGESLFLFCAPGPARTDDVHPSGHRRLDAARVWCTDDATLMRGVPSDRSSGLTHRWPGSTRGRCGPAVAVCEATGEHPAAGSRIATPSDSSILMICTPPFRARKCFLIAGGLS